jgi:hypothetical protein
MVELAIYIFAIIVHVVSVARLLDLCSILIYGPLSVCGRGHPDVDTVVVPIYWNKARLLRDGKVICVTRGLRFLGANREIAGDIRYGGVIEVKFLSGRNALVSRSDFSRCPEVYRILPCP